MFIVIGHAIAFSNGTNEGSKPYAGPAAPSKEEAVDAWKTMAIKNGETVTEIEATSDQLKASPVDTLITLYGGDEVVVVVELVPALKFWQ